MAEQTCKACDGTGKDFTAPRGGNDDFLACLICDGTGAMHRTGPYRLADGTWSDGVDRNYEVAAWMFGRRNPKRRSVNIDNGEGTFDVWQGMQLLNQFSEFQDAIAYADRMARTNQGENNGR